MKARTLALVAALAAVALAPMAVHAAKKEEAAAGGVTEAQRKQGMAEAPAIVQTAGLPCQVTDARFVGKVEDKKAKTSSSFYEVACQQGMGFVLQAPSGAAPTAFTCIEADFPADGSKPSLACVLPANADPKAALTPMMAKAGVSCTPEKVRGIGQSKTATYIEAACQGGAGYVVVASAPFETAKTPQVQNCLAFDEGGGNIKCTLTDHATRLAIVDTYAAAAKNGCTVKDRRFVGQAQDGSSFFEAACQDGKGYIYKVNNAGALATTYECAKASGILGGCQLTDAREAESGQAALYTKLAKNAGSSCEVEKYALFPMRGNTEVVELACKGGASNVGMFPATGKGAVLDCGHALVAGYKCGLGKTDYAPLTADLKKNGQSSCEVSGARLAAKTTKGTTLLEVTCADGYRGYMIEYNTEPTVTALAATGCAFSADCKMPGNTAATAKK
jgi:hypothetical protein